jgi:CO/xanthine dehydrogenase Mo-binding subunit
MTRSARSERRRFHLAVGSTEMGNGSLTSHRQIAASILGTRADSVAIINAVTRFHLQAMRIHPAIA